MAGYGVPLGWEWRRVRAHLVDLPKGYHLAERQPRIFGTKVTGYSPTAEAARCTRQRTTGPGRNHRAWKSLLGMAKVRDARLHDARHTAATMLLVLKVPLPAVMDIMGWSDASIAKRYMHVPRELVTAIAAEVGALMWARGDDGGDASPARDPASRGLD
jgi:integrase